MPPVTPPKVPPVTEGKVGKTLGKVGQAVLPCSIYAKNDIDSTVYYQLKAHEYLVVTSTARDGWVKVLLTNGQEGFVQADSIRVLDYQVTQMISNPPMPRNAADLALSKLGPVKEEKLDNGKFVQSVFGELGIKLSAKPSEQVKVGKKIARLEDLKKGDRVYFWDEKAEEIGQVGVYVGNGYMVHLNDSKGAVETVYIGSKDWLKKLVEARR